MRRSIWKQLAVELVSSGIARGGGRMSENSIEKIFTHSAKNSGRF